MLDTALPLGAFLDAQIARIYARCDDTSETADTIEVEPATMPELLLCLIRVMLWRER